MAITTTIRSEFFFGVWYSECRLCGVRLWGALGAIVSVK